MQGMMISSGATPIRDLQLQRAFESTSTLELEETGFHVSWLESQTPLSKTVQILAQAPLSSQRVQAVKLDLLARPLLAFFWILNKQPRTLASLKAPASVTSSSLALILSLLVSLLAIP